MPAVRADDSGEHERDYRRSGRDCKSVKVSVNRSGSLAMFAAMRAVLGE
jgi:hypothetical protein